MENFFYRGKHLFLVFNNLSEARLSIKIAQKLAYLRLFRQSRRVCLGLHSGLRNPCVQGFEKFLFVILYSIANQDQLAIGNQEAWFYNSCARRYRYFLNLSELVLAKDHPEELKIKFYWLLLALCSCW